MGGKVGVEGPQYPPAPRRIGVLLHVEHVAGVRGEGQDDKDVGDGEGHGGRHIYGRL